jgi:predicted P-loop ATPase
MGREMFWISVRPMEEVEEGTDRWAQRQGLVSLTPLRLDLTDVEALESARQRHPLESRRTKRKVRSDTGASARPPAPADAGRSPARGRAANPP